MIVTKTVNRTRIPLVVLPWCIHIETGSEISHGIILNGFGFSIFRAFQFIPFIVGQSVPIDILHNPNDTRFIR